MCMSGKKAAGVPARTTARSRTAPINFLTGFVPQSFYGANRR
jgi:hypothetical protein